MKIWTIYCHTHIESGRRYIGMTSRTMERRWSQHIIQSRSSKGGRWHFPNAIRKYGPHAFAHEALCQSWTLGGANQTEEELILQYNTRNPENGFNLAKGGAHTPHPIRRNPWDDLDFKNRHLPRALSWMNILQEPAHRSKNLASLRSQASREKRTASSRQVTSRPEVLEKIRATARRPMSDEQRAKMSVIAKARIRKNGRWT